MKIEEIKVKVATTEDLMRLLGVILPANQGLHIDKFAVFRDKYAIDTDCCFWELQESHFDGKIQKVINVECRIKKYNSEGGYSIRMDKADFVKTISLEDYLVISKEVNLVDFIRFNYNPRIMSNQNLLMKYINQKI